MFDAGRPISAWLGPGSGGACRAPGGSSRHAVPQRQQPIARGKRLVAPRSRSRRSCRQVPALRRSRGATFSRSAAEGYQGLAPVSNVSPSHLVSASRRSRLMSLASGVCSGMLSGQSAPRSSSGTAAVRLPSSSGTAPRDRCASTVAARRFVALVLEEEIRRGARPSQQSITRLLEVDQSRVLQETRSSKCRAYRCRRCC